MPNPIETRPPRRRLPWALLPLVLALAYAGVRALVGSRPALEAMVPADAVLVWRWKDVATYDAQRAYEAEPGKTLASPSAVLGAELNVPGLPGVDRSRAVVEALLAPEGRADPRLVVLPVADAAALEAKFRDPELIERHARHLEVHGAWAASCADRLVVRNAGTYSSPLPASEGEDWCVSARWPAFVDFVLRPEQASREPFASLLRGLGFEPDSAQALTEDGRPAMAVKAGRVVLVRDAWSRVTLRSFPGRVTVDLEPSDGAKELVAALAAAKPSPADDREVAPPSPNEASLHVRGAQGRRVLAYALGFAGMRWPERTARDDFAALRLEGPGSISAWAELAEGPVAYWSVSLCAPRAAFPDLSAFGPEPASDASPAAFPAGVATLTTPYGGTADATTFLPVPAAGDAGLLVTALGPRADAMRAKVAATAAATARSTPADTPDRIEIATFTLSQIPLQRLLGTTALAPNGLFESLANRPIRGRLVVVGGRRLRLELEGT